ncbi:MULTISPECIES: hypothetical protein [Pseudomonas]|uniref:Uncharacterized protein n=1 Tax=Pseudomonas orientalis TaxID=76758 RepID=A0A1H2G8N2_9PSED|nr:MULTISPECIES: hypothetical protein [Pseudomonas]KRP65430.1 hypothetical protein TU82_12345 [Pseudomonas orientalis]SDU15947.1 hypothetical protein SAMN04490197_3381 [Pseudomonas orientalis]
MKSLPFHGIIFLEKSEKIGYLDGTVHVALCTMAAEVFLEDLKSYYQSVAKLRPYSSPSTLFNMNPQTKYAGGGLFINGHMEYLQPSERELEDLINRIEKDRLIDKYETVIKSLNKNWKKGEDEDYKNLKRLITLRNKLVHMKSDEIELDADGNVSEHPWVLSELKRLNVLEDESHHTSWIYMLDTEKVVNWARVTVVNAIAAMLEIIPDTPISKGFRDSYASALKTFKFK